MATEHGWLIGMICVRPKSAYHQGVPRKFTRTDRFDYYWPKFAFLGEQPVLKKELYSLNGGSVNDTFGYVPVYSEYRFEQSRIAGEMRSSQSFWHLGRDFAAVPSLNESFMQCDPSTRIFAVENEGGGEGAFDEDQIYGWIHNHVIASRLMPKYGKPMM